MRKISELVTSATVSKDKKWYFPITPKGIKHRKFLSKGASILKNEKYGYVKSESSQKSYGFQGLVLVKIDYKKDIKKLFAVMEILYILIGCDYTAECICQNSCNIYLKK